ncbi:PAS domain S-box protein [Mesonia sp. K7]|uniref:sensor histidine kinase n=1 Tax=Mesonia sp. K7 TaxID=2218606 RepID=UPI000DAAC023|nr:PAS domain S-box protein [Mesonia sp. K7]PZD77782.1 hypothetical protein DNG35_08070 [Mesonia sp. K7]
MFNNGQLYSGKFISHVYPYQENKAALGLNILEYDLSKEEALRSMNNKIMFFAGPIPLKQGGEGIVGRMPVFIGNEFWGFSAVIIKEDELLNTIGVEKLPEMDLSFKIAKVDKISGEENFFYSVGKKFDVQEAESVFIEDGNWNMYVYSQKKDVIINTLWPLILSAIIISFFISFVIVNILKRPAKLQQLVNVQNKKILDTEAKFKTIFDRSPIGIVHIFSENSHFIDVNQHFLSLLGYEKQELEQYNFKDFWVDKAALDTLLAEKNKIETSFFKKDGSQIQVRVAITYLRDKNKDSYISTIEDVTKINEALADVKKLQSQMQMAIQIAQLGYWEWSVETDDVLWSPTLYEIFKIPKDTEISPELITSKIHPADRERYIESLKSLLNGEQVEPYEAKLLDPNNQLIHVLGHLESEKNINGEVTKIKGTLIDISSEKRIQEELDQSYDVVLEQNKRLINFSYIVSHNLRSHASNIKSISHILSEIPHSSEQGEMFEMLLSVTQALDDTLYDLNDVVNLQKIAFISKEELLIKKYINRVLNTLEPEIIDKKTEITVNIPKDQRINFNPSYFESILLNFISNAVKYKHPDRLSKIQINYLEKQGKKVIEIKDNGIGIDLNKNRDKLFGMYKTFTKNPDSRGLGLFISKSQMEALGGKIEVESKLGEGSTFRLIFK